MVWGESAPMISRQFASETLSQLLPKQLADIMKGSTVFVLLLLGIVATVSITLGLEAQDAESGMRLRQLSDDKLPATENAELEHDETHGGYHGGGGGGYHGGGGCYRGSRYWPHCRSRHLEEDAAVEESPDEMLERVGGGWHGGDRNCFPGSRFWPRCRNF